MSHLSKRDLRNQRRRDAKKAKAVDKIDYFDSIIAGSGIVRAEAQPMKMHRPPQYTSMVMGASGLYRHFDSLYPSIHIQSEHNESVAITSRQSIYNEFCEMIKNFRSTDVFKQALYGEEILTHFDEWHFIYTNDSVLPCLTYLMGECRGNCGLKHYDNIDRIMSLYDIRSKLRLTKRPVPQLPSDVWSIIIGYVEKVLCPSVTPFAIAQFGASAHIAVRRHCQKLLLAEINSPKQPLSHRLNFSNCRIKVSRVISVEMLNRVIYTGDIVITIDRPIRPRITNRKTALMFDDIIVCYDIVLNRYLHWSCFQNYRVTHGSPTSTLSEECNKCGGKGIPILY
jgi:hypothetical protein